MRRPSRSQHLRCQLLAPSLTLEQREHRGRVDASFEADDAGAFGEVVGTAIQVRVDAEDQAVEAGVAQAA